LVLGGIALVLAVTTVILSAGNRDLQQKLTDGQAKVARVQALSNLDNNLIQLLAKSAMDNKDDALRQLLESNGVTFKAAATSGTGPVAN
jgi:hypothetical protein